MTKYLVFKKEIITLHVNKDNLWEDDKGCIYAFRRDRNSIDKCGIGVLTIPNSTDYLKTLNKICSAHDYMYESPAYQLFNTRKEADEFLYNTFKIKNHSLVGKVFYNICRVFGGFWWENKETR